MSVFNTDSWGSDSKFDIFPSSDQLNQSLKKIFLFLESHWNPIVIFFCAIGANRNAKIIFFVVSPFTTIEVYSSMITSTSTINSVVDS